MASTAPIAVGVGLVALDRIVIEASGEERDAAGGSAANVMIALADLGWHSLPVAQLGADANAGRVVRDLEVSGADTRIAALAPAAPTPLIIELISAHDGHRFEIAQGYTALDERCVGNVLEALPQPPAVLYLDRASPAALGLARRWRALGTLVVFEPSEAKDRGSFDDMVAAAHVVKYSRERAAGRFAPRPGALLEIETLGAEGLRYRWRWRHWRTLPAIPVARLVDAAGSGDWCSAGIIDRLGRAGARGLERATRAEVIEALRFGQALATWNCGYPGARGGMRVTSAAERASEVATLLNTGY